jgi:hypothetical protein
MLTIVADERSQPSKYPYHTAGGTDVDLAILDKERMANLCHFVMVHTATSLALAQQGQPTRKQCGLKTGLKWFGSCGESHQRIIPSSCIKLFSPSLSFLTHTY